MPDEKSYDVVIVGAGLAGSLIAHRLGTAGLKVLILEAGRDVPVSREDYMERFYLQLAKVPESPYAPNPNAPRPTVLDLAPDGGWKNASATYLDQSDSKLPFSSTYERRGAARCGTGWGAASDSCPTISSSRAAITRGSTGRSATRTSARRARAGPPRITTTRRPRSASRRTSRISNTSG